MKTASYIIPYRENDCVDRRENLLAVCRWLKGVEEIEAIVVEQNDRPTLTDADVGGRVIFLSDPGPFNKSWCFNVGARLASTDILAFGDGDVLAMAGCMDSVNLCRQGWHGAKPYRRIVDLTLEETARIRAGEWDFIPARPEQSPQEREGQKEFVVFGGGLFILRKKVFWQISGFDERFIGWGGEDNAMTIKLTRYNAKLTGIISHDAVHLWHPRLETATFGQPNYLANRELVAEYLKLTDIELAGLCARQRDVIGNLNRCMPVFP